MVLLDTVESRLSVTPFNCQFLLSISHKKKKKSFRSMIFCIKPAKLNNLYCNNIYFYSACIFLLCIVFKYIISNHFSLNFYYPAIYFFLMALVPILTDNRDCTVLVRINVCKWKCDAITS